jgi:PAS domain S-box-containing protein
LEQIQEISRRNIMTVALMLALVMIGAAAALRALGRNARLLVRSRERFELAVAGSSDGIWDWDIDSGRMYFSPRWKSMIGFEDEEFENTFSRWEEQLHPEDRARVLHVLKDYLEGRSPVFEAEFRLRHKDGNKVWVLSRGAALRDRRGKPYRMAGSQTDITERRRAADEQARLQAQLIQTSRQAGMAEVATGVLHNVGNVLNSVTVSASLLRERLGKSQINNLVKATNLLRDNAADAVAFLTLDPKGQKLPGFIIKLGDHLASEQGAWQEELVGLSKNIEHIKEIVTMQQGFARLSGVTEILDVEELVEDALRINEDGLGRHGIKLVREFQEVPNVEVDKHKVLQILINLIRNAKHALDDSGKTEKSLIVSILTGNKDHVRIQVRDNGLGIAPENLARIFQHGFTTKKDGHGFGLHSGANAAREMGGNLTVHSGGPGMGATFTLVLPVAKTDTLPITKSNQGHSFGQSSPNTSPGTVADI